MENGKFMVYEKETGETEIQFSKLDVRQYANLVAKLCCPLHIKVYEFLKLVLESVRLIKLNTKTGFESAVRVEKHIGKESINLKSGFDLFYFSVTLINNYLGNDFFSSKAFILDVNCLVASLL